MLVDVLGYVKIKRIQPPRWLDNINYLFSLGFSDLLECENFLQEYNDYIIFDQVKQVFINNAGELQINTTDYYLIIGNDYRTVYTLYHNIMIKIGKITEWRKTPFSAKLDNKNISRKSSICF